MAQSRGSLHPRRLESLVRLGLVAGGVLAGLVLGSGFLELWCRATGRGVLQVGDTAGLNMRPSHFRPSENAFLGWEFDPKGYMSNQAGFELNSFGLADREYPAKKSAAVFRIAVIGDSITEQGWYVKELERLLNGSGLPAEFQVWNWGVGGYSISQYYHLLLERVFDTAPDMILIGFCLNDLNGAPVVIRNEAGGFDGYRNPWFDKTDDVAAMRSLRLPLSHYLFLRSHAYRYLAGALLLRSQALPSDPEAMSLLTARRILQEARSRDTPLFAVVIPYLLASYDTEQKRMYATMTQTLEAAGIPFLDLHGIFPTIGAPHWRDQPKDYIHPSERGHRLMAKKIYERMLADRRTWFKPGASALGEALEK